MFRNLTAHRLPADAIPTPEALAEAISARPLQPPGPLELHTVGFVSPRGRSHDVAPVTLDHDTLLSVGTLSRILPTQVINDAIDEKLDKLEAERGRRPGSKERWRIREEVINELMPRAFLKSGRVLLLAGIGALCFYLVRLALISHEIAIAKAEVRCVQARAAGAAGPECEEPRHGYE